MLAHEFKTPLSIIRMVAGSGQLDPRSSNFSESAIRDIDALLEKCLNAEVLMGTSAISEPVLLDLDELAYGIVANSHPEAAPDVQIKGQAQIRSDPALVRMILANLIDNALKYREPSSTVYVSISTDDGSGQDSAGSNQIAVRVSNVIGQAGVPDPEHVFDKYYRAPGAQSKSGSGLGLYLSKHIAQLLGGDLVFVAGAGSLYFEVRLPRQL